VSEESVLFKFCFVEGLQLSSSSSPPALGVLLVFHISNIDTQIISPVFTL